jgi:hypothetical protein
VSLHADARPWIDMGVKDDFAIDQPMVTLEVFDQLAGGGRGASLGPDIGEFGFLFSGFFLDTGATSIIAFNEAASTLEENGYITEGTVVEQGTAGFSTLDVSAEYYLEVTDSGGGTRSLPFTRIMSGQVDGLDGVNGLVGMPAMVGKVVTLDTGHWEELAGLDPFDPDYLDQILELLPLQVGISDSLPAAGHRYSVPIRAQTFHVMGDGPLPAEAPIPFVEMTVGNGDLEATGQFIVDTGASISFISTDFGRAIGLDSNNDGVLDSSDEQFFDSIPIGGIGGILDAPLFAIDRFSIATEQGVDLVWQLPQSLSVLIVDIDPAIDGVFGAELISSGWFSLLEEEVEGLGPLQQTHFDFRQFFADDDLGKIYFDLTPSFDVVLPDGLPGDYNDDGIVNAADYTVWRNSLGAVGSNLPADGNGSGSVEEGDYAIWKMHFGESAGNGAGGNAGAVPEASGLMLSLIAVSALAAFRRRQPPQRRRPLAA